MDMYLLGRSTPLKARLCVLDGAQEGTQSALIALLYAQLRDRNS